ncbi:MAG: hypothetical protein Q8J78_17140 [Moraxellaceae bacterium]|nr:hypothetical protein [Moraxellaceae bacterium]
MSPNSFISSSNSRHFLTGFALAASLLLLCGSGLGLYLGPPSGDLMRIGRMASIDWQPTRSQAPLSVMANPPDGPTDVLVLGDSFSAANAWQSEVSRRHGLRLETWHYNSIVCLDDWLQRRLRDPSTNAPRHIIVQSIERETLARFSAPAQDCSPGKQAPRALAVPASTLRSDDLPSLYPVDLRYLLAAATHHFRSSNEQGRQQRRSAVTVDLTDSARFSNRRAARLAYFHGDERQWEDWTAARQSAAVRYFEQLRTLAAAHGKQLHIVIVPNKSTSYAPWVKPGQRTDHRQPELFTELEAVLGRDSNYLPAFRHAAGQQIDFYRPDDTHLSLDGYRGLAELVARRSGLEKRLP